MSIPLNRELHEPRLEEGEHTAAIREVEERTGVQTAFGEKDQIVITFDVEGVALLRRYTKSMFPKSNLYKLISTLAHDFDGFSFDAEDLVDMPCRVVVEHVRNEETGVWDNITNVLRPKVRQPSSLDELADMKG